MLETYLKADAVVREIAPHLYTVLDSDDEGARYDAIAAMYDRMVSSPLYLRLAWGVTREANVTFIQQALGADADGCVVDLAAGSCVDAVSSYAGNPRPTIVVDRSLGMLQKGMERLTTVSGGIPAHVFFVQADALDLPFRQQSIATLLCHGAFHLLPSIEIVMGEWRRVLEENGTVFVSCLVKGRWFGDRYLRVLHRAGEISTPLSAGDFEEKLSAGLGAAIQVDVVGNFAYARTG